MTMIESKDHTDDQTEKRFQEEKKQLHTYMENNPDKEAWVRKYMLKRLLELGEKKDFGWNEIVIEDIKHIQKVYDWNLKKDVYRDYQKNILSQIRGDLFQSLNATEKRAIATSFGDLKDVVINGETYEREFSEQSWDDYFTKNNIPVDGFSQNMEQQRMVMDKIAEILYGKKFNDLFDLHTNPQKVHKIQAGRQSEFPFEK